jgi:glycosyltransferase involved in cell wall biosynthesis
MYSSPRIAFVYDRVNKWGGAERVLLALHEIWPDAPLYTAVYNPQTSAWAKPFKVIASGLNRLPFITTHHEWFAPLMPYAFESFDFSAYDIVISITSAEAKGIITKPNQLHLCYLLTPTRYLWSHRHEYQGKGLLRAIRKPFMDRLARWDLVAASRPDNYIAISEAVAKRCQTFYQRQCNQVIYPPVEVAKFRDHPSDCLKPEPGYFLIVSRLVPYKQVDLAIKACNQTGDRLIIVGSGSESKRLKRLAGPTITFTGPISDEKLACYYHHAKALLFPQEEEFGIVALEAQSAGLPVIAYKKGSALEIIKPGETGILFDAQTPASLIAAIHSFKSHTWYDKTIKAHARQFDRIHFMRQFKQTVEDVWQQHLQSK